MKSVKFIIAVVMLCCNLNLRNGEPQPHYFENCKIESYQKKFDILPGRGWDNLQNQPMAQIFNLNFSKCKFSQDNIYLIPDFVSLTPTKTSEVTLSAEKFNHFLNYTSLNSESINIEPQAGFYGVLISGSFSTEKEQVKIDQLQTKTSIERVQLRYNVFKSIAEPNAQLDPTFRNRIIDIAGILLEAKDSIYPKYLAEMIVRDYGTHIIQSIDAGAVLSKIDLLSEDYEKSFNGDSNKISVIASASFGELFKLSAKYTKRVNPEQTIQYDNSALKTRIVTIGGTLYGGNFTIDDWRQSVMENLISIDRAGDPIYFVITPKRFGELDEVTVNEVHNLVKDAVINYYFVNTQPGCLDIKAKNFNRDANLDNQNCESPKVNFNFGGVFQKCTGPEDQCSEIRQVNSLTGNYLCSEEYQEILLQHGPYKCKSYCQSKYYFWEECETKCSEYEVYWCSPINGSETVSGYKFGGVISEEKSSCPQEYFPVKVGLSAQICLSTNNNPSDQNSIRFGGFFSCVVGNALANDYKNQKENKIKESPINLFIKWPKTCAEGYISHPLAVDQGCQISYCTETNKVSLGSRPILKRPPFISLNYNPNSTKVVVFSTADGKKFIKSQLGNWETKEVKKNENLKIIASVLGTFFPMLIIAIIALIIQHIRHKRKLNGNNGNTPLVGIDNNNEAV